MAVRPDERERGKRLWCDIGGSTVMLQMQDLDPVGLFIPTHEPLELDREIDVRLRSPIGMLRARAHVVQVITPERAVRERKRAGFAVVFLGLADDQRAWIGLTLGTLEREAPAGDVPVVAPEPLPIVNPPKAPEPLRISNRPTAPAPPSAATERRQGFVQQAPSMLARLEQALIDIEGKSPWELLGLDQHADPEAARKAFLDVCKRYHPHAYARFDCDEVSRMATRLFIAHKRAYTKLASLRPPPAPSSQVPARLITGRVRGEVG